MVDAVARSRVLRSWSALLLAFLLAACGGGGGGGGGAGNSGGSGGTGGSGGSGGGGAGALPPMLQYTGRTTASALDANTAPRMASALMYELGLMSGGEPLAAQASTERFQFSGALTKLSKHRPQLAKTRTRAVQAVTSESCPEGGTLQIDDRTDANGLGVIVLTHTACVEEGVRTDGVLNIRVDAYDLVRDAPTDFTAAFHGYTLTSGAFTIEVGGTVRSVLSGDSVTTTFNTVTRYRPEEVQHRYESIVIVEHPHPQLASTHALVTISGRFFHSTHGYIDVGTSEPLTAPSGGGLASAGALRLQGASAALAHLRFVALDEVVLSLDEDGDGATERALHARGLDQLIMPNHAPVANAGADQTISEGETASLDGSGSFDWEGAALTYSWSIQSGPTGVGATIGSQQQIEFNPTTPGIYTITLSVEESGQPFGASDSMILTVLDNAAPVARAGEDVTVVERSTVTLDGGSSTDAENDTLQYAWQLITAPSETTAPRSGDGQTLSFAANQIGPYVYRLTVSDAFGSSTDVVTIIVERLVQIGFLDTVVVTPSTTQALATRSAQVVTNSAYSGSPVSLSVTADAPWLDIVSAPAQTGSEAEVVVAIDPQQLESMENGEYLGYVTVTPAGGYTPIMSMIVLVLELPRVSYISPYVAYADQSQTVTLYGESLHLTAGGALIINDIEVTGFAGAQENLTRISLPALPVGEYEIQIRNNLGIQQPMGRYVVRMPPVYPEGEFDITGRVESLEYDAERDAFYVVSRDPDGVLSAYRLRLDGAEWRQDEIMATAPQALTLNADGTRLIVTTSNCGVHEHDPVTLALLHTSNLPSCFYEIFGMASGLADGQILVADTNQWPTVYLYPDFTSLSFPSIHNPIHVLNHTRERMIWAESPTISAPRSLHLYDLATNSFEEVTMNDEGTYFLASNLAISGNGARMMHTQDVYDGGEYVGSLEGVSGAYLSPALTYKGDRALVLNPDTNSLHLFDLSAGPSFPEIGDAEVLADDVGGGTRIMLLPTDSAAFVFTSLVGPSGVAGFKMYVRDLP